MSRTRHRNAAQWPTVFAVAVLTAGATDMYERARRRACEILESHEREPLDKEVMQRMRAVVARADRERGS